MTRSEDPSTPALETRYVHPTYPRTVPARRPAGHRSPPRRFSLRWNKPVPHLIADWFGVQGATPGSLWGRTFLDRFESYRQHPGATPDAIEFMSSPCDETGAPTVVVVVYWTSALAHARWSRDERWTAWWQSEDRLAEPVGYWRETLVCPYDRHETIFSDGQYRIGLGQTRAAELVEMGDSGYFGAARDRIPASAVDELRASSCSAQGYDGAGTWGRRITMSNPSNTTVVRSGQFWDRSEPEQAHDYESQLRPKLDHAMDYLAGDPASGCVYLRRLTNLDRLRRPRRETSVFAVFQDLRYLEHWAASHASHHAIYDHAKEKGRQYGARRDVITWHEAFVLPAGNRFEYVNCAPGTGMTRWAASRRATHREL